MTVTTQLAGTITDEQSRGVYQDLLAVAEQTPDPAQRAAKIALIKSHALAAGKPIPEPAAVRPEHALFDAWNGISATTAAAAAPTGYPAAIPENQLAMFRKAAKEATTKTDPAPVFGDELPEALQRVDTWLTAAAAPAQRTELLVAAKGNVLVLRSLLGYANAHQRYSAGRPK